MNVQTQCWRLSRRHLLRGLGASIALPMLDCMRPLRGATPTPPKRAVFIYLPNGVNTLDYQILDSGKDYTFSRGLKPLERFREVITPISGMHHPHGIGHHHGCQSIWLTGAEMGAGKRNSVSLDQLIAEKTAPLTRFASLELSNTGRSLSYNRDGIQLPAETKPAEIFRRLFEAPKGGIEEERLTLQRQGSILDAVLDEAKELDRRIGSEDKTRLDQYLTSVREVEIRTERANGWLDVPRPEIDDAIRRKLDRDVSQQDTADYFRTMYDLIVLAFETDMTRVVTFSSGDEGKGLPIPALGINQTRHSLSHHNGDPAQMDRLTQSDQFNFEQFAYFLDRLSRSRDESGSLLDSTVSLFGSGMAYGHSHGNANLPLVVAGGKEMGFQHGQHVDFNEGHFDGYDLDEEGRIRTSHYQLCHRPLNPDARMSNLLLGLGRKMDVEVETFADSLGSFEC